MTGNTGSGRMGPGPDRREFIALGIGAFIIAGVPWLRVRGGSSGAALHRRTVPAMGTFAEFAVGGMNAPAAHRAMDAAVAELARVERLLTRFENESDVGRANDGASREAVRVTPETASVVAEALRWARETGGAFDPAIGGAVALWEVGRRTEPPPAGAIARFAGRRMYERVEVREGDRASLRYADADAAIDLGGIAKGYGVDRAADALRAAGVTHALVNVGGDLYAIGGSPDGSPWRIGIRDPDDSRGVLITVPLRDAAMATSGTYEHFFRHRGVRYHHLIDPLTGEPRHTAHRTLTVRARTCMQADAAATALFGMEGDVRSSVLAGLAGDAQVVHEG